jgi:hypothetical protein
VTEPNSRSEGESAPEPLEPDPIPLVSFLKANAAAVPEPASGLEDRLMQATLLEAQSSLRSVPQQQSRTKYSLKGLRVAFIGVGLAIAGVGLGQFLQWFTSPRSSTTELAQLESFLIDGWDETVQSNETSTDWDWLKSNATFADPALVSVAKDHPSFTVTTHSQR